MQRLRESWDIGIEISSEISIPYFAGCETVFLTRFLTGSICFPLKFCFDALRIPLI
jgi:hypothetical protein